MSAACNQVRLPAKARQMTSCSFIIRSTAPHAMPMNGLLSIHGCTWVRPKSGHFTCTRERTDHVLPTVARAGALTPCASPTTLAGDDRDIAHLLAPPQRD